MLPGNMTTEMAVTMITSVQFQNVRVLKDARLPLGRFTLIVGPNSSGKTTALNALSWAANQTHIDPTVLRSNGVASSADVEVTVDLRLDGHDYKYRCTWGRISQPTISFEELNTISQDQSSRVVEFLKRV